MALNKKPVLLFIIGTRPECIKVSPVILEARQRQVEHRICFTGQHREMAIPILELFEIKPDYFFDIMKPNQTLNDISLALMTHLKPVLADLKPTHIVVQGDTTSAAVAGMMGFYEGIEVVHIEAGLRTYDLSSPWPEEFNRRLIGLAATWHFTPSQRATDNLVNEGVRLSQIYMIGNTGVDALRVTASQLRLRNRQGKAGAFVQSDEGSIKERPRFQILVTLHRRESFGEEMTAIMQAILQVVENHEQTVVRWPLHQNPQVKAAFKKVFGEGHARIHQLQALGYAEFVEEMMSADLILTDSGGVQEEAPFLGKPVLICRKNTERPEVVECGSARLVGTSQDNIVTEVEALLNKSERYQGMAQPRTPYGDGYAAGKIFNALGLMGGGLKTSQEVR